MLFFINDKLSPLSILLITLQISKFTFAANVNNLQKSLHKFRISGGYRPENHTLAKYVVSLRSINETRGAFGSSHFCAGSIISPNTVLTAAHCVVKISGQAIYKLSPHTVCVAVGSPLRLSRKSTKVIQVDKINVHRQFDVYGMKNDIALLHLAKDIVEDDITAQRIPLPSQKPKEGTECITTGWGRILQNGPLAAELTYANIVIRSQKSCNKIYKFKNDRVICSTDMRDDKGLCKGDSGGPLICDGHLVGITSFGFCGATAYPYGFTNVYYYRHWIENCAFQLKLSVKYFTLIISCAISCLILKYIFST